MSKDLRLTFSEDAVNYDRWRPRYVPELFDKIGGVEYVALLNTYSDHRAMPEAERLGLEREIMAVILRYGGTITICDTMDLYLAKRPL